MILRDPESWEREDSPTGKSPRFEYDSGVPGIKLKPVKGGPVSYMSCFNNAWRKRNKDTEWIKDRWQKKFPKEPWVDC
jgi:hypothetical protein